MSNGLVTYARAMAMSRKSYFSTQTGLGLVEVMVALFVLAVGLLGMAALQIKAQQAEMESYQRIQALILLEDISNRVSANKVFRAEYDLDSYLGVGATVSLSGKNASVAGDLAAWDSLLKGAAEVLDGNQIGAMVGARGCIEVSDDANEIIVSVAWQGFVETLAPADLCAQNLYGNDGLRRVVSRTLNFAVLN